MIVKIFKWAYKWFFSWKILLDFLMAHVKYHPESSDSPDFIKWSQNPQQVKGREKNTLKKQQFYLKPV